MKRRLRVASVHRVCVHYRVSTLAQFSRMPGIELTVLHGADVPGTKLRNSPTIQGFRHRELWTLSGMVTTSRRRNPWSLCPTAAWHLARLDPDVIFVEGGSNIFTNVGVYLYALVFNKPVVWWTIGELRGRSYSPVGRAYRWVVRQFERAARARLGYSSAAAAYFRDRGYPSRSCFVAINCVDTNRVLAEIATRRAEARQLRAELGLIGRFVVLFVGALDEGKRIDRLLDAFARIRVTAEAARLVIVGDGAARPALEQRAAELGLSAATHFAGRVVERVSDYYELGDVFVLPGLGGMVVSEALCHGLPVICNRGDGVEQDFIRNGQNGYVIDREDDEEVIGRIVECVARLIADPERHARMRRAAADTIARRLNVNVFLENLYAAARYAALHKDPGCASR